MSRFIRKTRKTAGTAPGTLPASQPLATGSQIRVMAYSQTDLNEIAQGDIEQVRPLINGKDTVWIHVTGLQNADLLTRIGDLFNIHALTLEDIAYPGHRPKFEDVDDYFFMILKQLDYNSEDTMLSAGQISMVVRDNLLLSFQEKEDDCLEPVRKRLRAGRGRIRNSGAGYLVYALVDAIVDHYFHALSRMGDDIETLETQMLDDLEPWHLEEIHRLKREIIFFHKQVWPVREVVSRLIRSESPVMPTSTDRFMSDVSDHMGLILDTVESFRELTASMQSFYMSAMGDRMNQVMRTLTIIATIFIPLTFMAGIYGMNFKFMPELDWKWGYFALLGLMTLLGGGMMIYFKRKKWF